jgi:hypothetical protein
MSLGSSYSARDPLTPGSSNYRVVDGTEADAKVLTQAGDILRELHTLLEDYAPVWYTERHHAGIVQTLHDLNQFISRRSTVSGL